MTNFDRIKGMSVEELAYELFAIETLGFCENKITLLEDRKKWLESEINNDKY